MSAGLLAPTASRRHGDRCSMLLTALLCLCATLASLASVAASTTAAVYETDEYIRIQPELSGITEKRSGRTVLAYITPWNPKGAEMVDEYADKIDMVSPVWYTILVSRDSIAKSSQHVNGADASYVLSGGPPSKAEEAWLERKQQQIHGSSSYLASTSTGGSRRITLTSSPTPPTGNASPTSSPPRLKSGTTTAWSSNQLQPTCSLSLCRRSLRLCAQCRAKRP